MKTLINRLSLPSPKFFINLQIYLTAIGILIAFGGSVCEQFGFTGLNNIFISIGSTIVVLGNLVSKLTVDWQKVEVELKKVELTDTINNAQ